jgi:hypothetical protein
VEAEATRTATPPAMHAAAMTPTTRSARSATPRRLPKSATATTYRLLCTTSHLLLPEKFKPLGITKYDTKQDLVQWLRCYALAIENVVATTTRSVSTSHSVCTRLHSHGSSHSTRTRSTSETS